MTALPRLDPDVPHLVSARLLLRRPQVRDAAAIQALADDWEVAQWMSRVPHPYHLADAAFFIETIVPAEPCWAITDRATGVLAGLIGLAPVASPDGAVFGYWLGRRHWGHGFATEAGQAVIHHAFDMAGLPRIRSGHFAGNARSAHVLDKLGFRLAGHSQRMNVAHGERLPHVDLMLTRDTWCANRH